MQFISNLCKCSGQVAETEHHLDFLPVDDNRSELIIDLSKGDSRLFTFAIVQLRLVRVQLSDQFVDIDLNRARSVLKHRLNNSCIVHILPFFCIAGVNVIDH